MPEDPTDPKKISNASLRVKMRGWSPEKRETYFRLVAVVQVHSFAISGVKLDKEKTLQKIRRTSQN